MSFITASREQQVLFGYSLDEFVPADAKCRFVVNLVGELDLHGLYAGYSDQGGAAFDPAVMLATWFFAYSEGVTSTREVESRCLRDMHFIYVSGDLKPDHTSLSRFRKRHLEQLPELFVQLVRLAQERGLSSFSRICIDGTRLKANASRSKSLDASGLDKALAEVRSDIAGYLERCELEDAEGSELEQTRQHLAKLRELEARYEARRRELEVRQAKLQAQNRKGHRINVTDPDALSMKKVNGVRGEPGYNGQASVDAESGLIVAAEVVPACNDAGQFSAQHAKVEGTLGESAERQYVADAGYSSLGELDYVDHNGVDAVIADSQAHRRSGTTPQGVPEGERRFTRADFSYDVQADHYTCPAGEVLVFRQERSHADGRRERVYGRTCTGCAHAGRCYRSGSATYYRRVFRDVREGLAEAMARKAQSEAGRRRMHERFACSESVFGNLKENLGFRGVRLRGLASVRGEFMLMCLGHNLNRLFRLRDVLGGTPKQPGPGPLSPLHNLVVAFYMRQRAAIRAWTARFRFCLHSPRMPNWSCA